MVGASMAGKSSITRTLMRGASRLTTVDERTIGLDILRIYVRDPRGRVAVEIEFVAYVT